MKRCLKLIAVGASAGGLDALIEFFHGVPADVQTAFLVIQHLSPDHESIMGELIAPHVKLPIEEAEDGKRLSGGKIYFCPPAVIPHVDGMVLRLEPRAKDQSPVLPINILFSSLARTPGSDVPEALSSGDMETVEQIKLLQNELRITRENLETANTYIAEQAQLEKRFEFALKTAKLSWWDWDIETSEIKVQSAGHCLLGEGCLSVERDRGGWMEAVHPDDRERVEGSLNACLSGETEEWNCDHRFLTSEGRWLWVNNQGVVSRRSPDGEPLVMIGTTRDIDDYKRVLLGATNQRDMLEAAGDIAQLGYWDYDPETGELVCSTRTRKILGVEEGADPVLEDAIQLFLPPDDERLSKAFGKAVSEGIPYDLELRCLNANGKHCMTRASGRPHVDSSGKVTRVVGIFQDVTDVLTTEHEMSAFFEVSPDFQATVTYQGRFKSFNSSWTRELGYSSEELLAMHLSEIVAPVEREGFKAILSEVVAGETVSNYETRIDKKCDQCSTCDASPAWLSWSMSSDQELEFVVVSARCVTAQKQGQQALEEARIRAEEASRAKTDFLAVMSHELRTPLNPILGYTDMLLEEIADEEQCEILKTISQSGDQMITIIDELLDYSKLDAGNTKVELVDFSLEDLISEKVRLMSGMLKDRACTLNYSIDWGVLDEKACPVMRGDDGMVSQILRNLVANAIKFTEEGQIDIDASIIEASKGKCIVEFQVKDTGIGIAAEDIDKLFVPFSQVDTGMTRQFGGTGLGLAICQRLTGLMEGAISVESQLGEGSTFKVRLPFDYRLSENEGTQSSPSSKAPSHTSAGQSALKGHVLVVEDNQSNAYYIEKLIEVRGVQSTVACDGESALEKIAEEDFQLILLDLHMPGIGGIETLKRLRQFESQQNKAHAPVIILTADASEDAKQQSIEYGADGLLTKPIRPPAVYEILSKYL